MSSVVENLKVALYSPSVFTYPDSSKPFIAGNDASSFVVRAIFAQNDDEGKSQAVQ